MHVYRYTGRCGDVEKGYYEKANLLHEVININ